MVILIFLSLAELPFCAKTCPWVEGPGYIIVRAGKNFSKSGGGDKPHKR